VYDYTRTHNNTGNVGRLCVRVGGCLRHVRIHQVNRVNLRNDYRYNDSKLNTDIGIRPILVGYYLRHMLTVCEQHNSNFSMDLHKIWRTIDYGPELIKFWKVYRQHTVIEVCIQRMSGYRTHAS